MTEDQIKHMRDRFLGWKLPSDFRPDGGVEFNRYGNPGTKSQYENQPTGTNLLDAQQAEAMIRYMLEGLPVGDSNVAAVREKMRQREIQGFDKYGVSTDRTDLTPEQWLTHLQEELMDACVYTQRMFKEIATLRGQLIEVAGEEEE